MVQINVYVPALMRSVTVALGSLLLLMVPPSGFTHSPIPSDGVLADYVSEDPEQIV